MISKPNVKVNLGLNVLRKREDGYHDLETLFVPYSGICDTLEIVKGDEFSETSASLSERYRHGDALGDDRPSRRDAVQGLSERYRHGNAGGEIVPTISENQSPQAYALGDEIAQAISEDGKLMITIAKKGGADWDPLKDLTAKAYRILDKDFNLGPVKIFLEKTSPVGAGLGGGSSDAAFALLMLNGMFGLGLSKEALAGNASGLGSDCAFFIYNEPMIGEGRGEILSAFPLEGIDWGQANGARCPYHLEVVVPEGIAVSTAEAYKGIVPHIPEKDLRSVLSGGIENWKDSLANDFEATVFKAHPELEAIKRSLYDSGAVYAAMSGSGSALFGIYKTSE